MDAGNNKMTNTNLPMDIFNQNEFYNANFADLKLDGLEIINKTFEDCNFINSSFNEASFISCKFVECEFKSCNLSSIKLNNTSFLDVIFNGSKLLGINWSYAKWPYIKLASPIKFYQCNISYSSFYELDLKEILIEECKAYDVDFREANLSNGSFMRTDFDGSLFMHTKLNSADFTDAINYSIHPIENDIRKGKFSLPDALALLNSFEIEIID